MGKYFFIMVLSSMGLVVPMSTLARDSYDKPSLEIPKSSANLDISFVDKDIWDGKHIDKKMQCNKLGGEHAASPKLIIFGSPAETASLVVYFYNPRAFHNHGMFRVKERNNQGEWVVPSVRNNVDVEKLPKRVEIFDGGSSWGKAYNAPCPTQGTWSYTVTVYALDQNDKVVGIGVKDIGFAP